ncbi:hypothetical protein RFI_01019 [Reticulomyxa filosa]|uniref:PB1 domain-containing protein n=1 Tax=Reticulomyxa filosa TaxID=46433 RepID=X6PD63_RETFI|nr:hypothetical protein RFI_01019 [Reticulomyxa filosa]|eukprot:ETO36048.1 hypothetical protein RFI_01019 [Reticulomyxa filosa]
MKVKVVFGKDIRRWHYPPRDKYNDLITFVEKTFNLNDKSDYYLQFEDEEMDKMTISNEHDFEEAFNTAEQEKRPSLKIFVAKGSIENAQKVYTCATLFLFFFGRVKNTNKITFCWLLKIFSTKKKNETSRFFCPF